ncbi:MAG: hypothetical protein ACFFGZ_18180 [Candidatus Thorarchaeota archaeon]
MALMAQAQEKQAPQPEEVSVKSGEKQIIGEKTPVEALSQFIRGNIEYFGFVTRPDAQQFFESKMLGKRANFDRTLRKALQKVRRTLNCRVSKVAVLSLTSPQKILLFAKDWHPDRKGS